MTAFRIDAEIFERFPELKLGILVLNDINNTMVSEKLSRLLKDAQETVRKNLGGITLSQHPYVAPWREAYRAFGVKAKDYPSSIENLLKRVLKGENLRSINPLVDLYNVVSLRHLVPVGGEDIDRLKGDLVLRFAGGDEAAVHLLGEVEAKAPKLGEVIYADDMGAVCRRFNWKEADRSKLTPETKRAILVVEALPPVDENQLKAALEDLKAFAEQFCQASATIHILGSTVPMVDLAS